jgi:hypothetical protein
MSATTSFTFENTVRTVHVAVSGAPELHATQGVRVFRIVPDNIVFSYDYTISDTGPRWTFRALTVEGYRITKNGSASVQRGHQIYFPHDDVWYGDIPAWVEELAAQYADPDAMIAQSRNA